MVSVLIQEKILNHLLQSKDWSVDYLQSLLFQGEESCLSHLQQRKARKIICSKCIHYQNLRNTYPCATHKVQTKITTEGLSFLCLNVRQKVVLDDLSYRVLSSWICLFTTSAIGEVFDVWRCASRRHVLEEKGLPCDENLLQELREQVEDLLADLDTLSFACRRLSVADFFVRPLAFSYLDEQGKHRQGDVKLCLRVPAASSLVFGGQALTSTSGATEQLYTCAQLLDLLYND